MGIAIVVFTLLIVIGIYFRYNPLNHHSRFMFRRFLNWFPLGMTYAFLYMARYNLSVTKNALGPLMSKESFGLIFGAGTITYGLAFFLNGPLVDKLGGKKGIITAAVGACIANIGMGIVTYLILHKRWAYDLTLTFAILYSLNMFFQSYGAVAIIKVNAYWFHVRERGIFGAIFGTLLSFGVYFAFDWGQAIANASKLHLENPNAFQRLFRQVFAVDTQPTDAIWLVFFIPAAILIVWTVLDTFLIKDTPSLANLEDFDTHDASSGEMHLQFTMRQTLKRVLTHPTLMMIACVEFTTGVIRNGVMQWYFIFAAEVKQPGAEFFLKHWGLLLCVSGIIGGFTVGYVSDRHFQSRRSPPVAIAGSFILVLCFVMFGILFRFPFGVGTCAVLICLLSISIHSLMSGIAAADFGGRKFTATASGITDGFVYLGTGLQSVCLGYLTTRSWLFWPAFLVPFSMIGIYLAVRMWRHLPDATRRYLVSVEKISVVDIRDGESEKLSIRRETIECSNPEPVGV